MKFIPKNRIQNVAVSAETYVYRGYNVLAESPEEVWESASTSGTLTLTVGQGDCVALYNHNADNISISIQDLDGGSLAGPYATDLSTRTYGTDSLWQEYTEQTSLHNVVISFTNARANPLFCGIAYAGDMVELNNPTNTLNLSYINYSLNYVLSSRSFKQTDKAMKKRFTTQSILAPGDDWFSVQKYLKNDVSFKPIPWLLLDEEATTHNVFGYLGSFGSGRYTYPFAYDLPLEITER